MRALDLVATWPVPAAAAGVLARRTAPGGPRAAHGIAADPESHEGVELVGTVGAPERSYAWASVTKLCTALAVLVAVEEKSLALDDAAGPPGSTVAHLLAHASGLAPDRRDPITAPGTRRIYSNAGYELLADHVAERTGMPFGEYLREAVLVPLGMTGAQFAPGASAAAGMHGSLADLLALGAELLAPTIVSADTLDRATTVAFPGLAGVLPGYGSQDPCDWGLGFEIADGKRPHWTGTRRSTATFGHFGRAGSFLWVDPELGVACGALSARTWGPWTTVWPELSDAVIETLAPGDPDGAGRSGAPQRPT